MIAALAMVGCASIHSSDDAPFRVAGRTQLFATNEYPGGLEAIGLVYLTDEDLTCADVEGNLFEILPTAFAGDGLALAAFWSASPDRGFDGDPWVGLFPGSLAVDRDDEGALSRAMTPLAFQGGLYSPVGSYSGSDAGWLRIDTHDASTVRGEFATDWWRGKIDAEVCGDFTTNSTTDTGDRVYGGSG